MIRKFSRIHLEHHNIYWKSKPKNFPIVAHFNSAEWHKIYYDVDTDEEFNELLQCSFVYCLVVYEKPQTPFGFVILLNIFKDKSKLAMHGGLWQMEHTGRSYYVIVVLIDWLLKRGYKIRTSCLISNDNAFRFLHSLGFICYRSNDLFHYLWLKEQRFRSSAIYQKMIR